MDRASSAIPYAPYGVHVQVKVFPYIAIASPSVFFCNPVTTVDALLVFCSKSPSIHSFIHSLSTVVLVA